MTSACSTTNPATKVVMAAAAAAVAANAQHNPSPHIAPMVTTEALLIPATIDSWVAPTQIRQKEELEAEFVVNSMQR